MSCSGSSISRKDAKAQSFNRTFAIEFLLLNIYFLFCALTSLRYTEILRNF
jgi:hypothetical protein